MVKYTSVYSVQFSHSVVSDSRWPHESQHARPPCPSPSPGVHPNSCAGWHHWLDGHGFGWTLGLGDGQGGLACCGSWGRKESDTTEWLNWTEALFHSELWFYFTKCMKTFFLFLTNFPKSNSKWSVVCFCFLLQTNFEIPQRALEYFKRFVLSPYKKENVTGVRLIWYVKLHGFVLIIKLFPTLLQPHGL